MPDEMQLIASREGVSRAVCDYISGMTDGYAMEKIQRDIYPHVVDGEVELINNE